MESGQVNRKFEYFPNKKWPRRVSRRGAYHVSAVEMETITRKLLLHSEYFTETLRNRTCCVFFQVFPRRGRSCGQSSILCLQRILALHPIFPKGPLPPFFGIALIHHLPCSNSHTRVTTSTLEAAIVSNPIVALLRTRQGLI